MRDSLNDSRARWAVAELERSSESAGWLVDHLAAAAQGLPYAEAWLAKAVKAKKLTAKEAQSLVSGVLKDASEVQRLRERLTKAYRALSPYLPPESGEAERGAAGEEPANG